MTMLNSTVVTKNAIKLKYYRTNYRRGSLVAGHMSTVKWDKIFEDDIQKFLDNCSRLFCAICGLGLSLFKFKKVGSDSLRRMGFNDPVCAQNNKIQDLKEQYKKKISK